jgi:hypothetical protein
MKKFQVLNFAVVALVIVGFSSCQLVEPVEPAKERTGIWVGLGKRFNDCAESNFLCIRTDYISTKEMLGLPLEIDQAVSEPVVQADGSIQMEMDVEVENLSPHTRDLLLAKKTLVLDETVVLSGGVMRQAYENADLTYEGQRLEIIRGVYPVSTPDLGGTPPERISITITISKGTITITVRW